VDSQDILAHHILTTYAGVLWNVARRQGRRGEAEDNVCALRVHLLAHREAIARKAAAIGWESQHMKNYVAAACRHYLSSQKRKGAHKVQSRKSSIYREDGTEIAIPVNIHRRGITADDIRGWHRTYTPGTDSGPPTQTLRAIIPVATWQPSTAGIDVARAIEKLPAEQATAFRARYTTGTNGDFRVLEKPRPWREVAELAGMKERTAQRRVTEAFESMRAAVARQ
jgi:DNA-directed RNA polymerase specialized sigma24 family protein